MEAFQQRHKKQTRSCDRCRIKKRRCSGNNPCINCLESGSLCTMIVKQKKRGPKKGTVRTRALQTQMTTGTTLAPQVQNGDNLQYLPLIENISPYSANCKQMYPTPEMTPHPNLQTLPGKVALEDSYVHQDSNNGGPSPYWNVSSDRIVTTNNTAIDRNDIPLLAIRSSPSYLHSHNLQNPIIRASSPHGSSDKIRPECANRYASHYNCTVMEKSEVVQPLLDDLLIECPVIHQTLNNGSLAPRNSFNHGMIYTPLHHKQNPSGVFLNNDENLSCISNENNELHKPVIIIYSNLIDIFLEKINPSTLLFKNNELFSEISEDQLETCAAVNYVYALSCLEVTRSRGTSTNARYRSLLESSYFFAQTGARLVERAIVEREKSCLHNIVQLGRDSLNAQDHIRCPEFTGPNEAKVKMYNNIVFILDTLYSLSVQAQSFFMSETLLVRSYSGTTNNLDDSANFLDNFYTSYFSEDQATLARLCLIYRQIVEYKRHATASSINTIPCSCCHTLEAPLTPLDWKNKLHEQLVSLNSNLPLDKKLLYMCRGIASPENHVLPRSLTPYVLLTSMMYLYLLGVIHTNYNQSSEAIINIQTPPPYLYKLQEGMKELNSNIITSLAADCQANLLLLLNTLSPKTLPIQEVSGSSELRYPGKMFIDHLILPRSNKTNNKQFYS